MDAIECLIINLNCKSILYKTIIACDQLVLILPFLFQVDRSLTQLAKYTKEDDQQTVLAMIAKRSALKS